MELRGLFEGECVARLQARVPPQYIAIRELKVALLPESQVDARVAPIYKTFSDVQTTILAGAGEIQLHFRCCKGSQTEAEARVEELVEEIDNELGDAVTAELFTEISRGIDKWLWFVEAHSQATE